MTVSLLLREEVKFSVSLKTQHKCQLSSLLRFFIQLSLQSMFHVFCHLCKKQFSTLQGCLKFSPWFGEIGGTKSAQVDEIVANDSSI